MYHEARPRSIFTTGSERGNTLRVHQSCERRTRSEVGVSDNDGESRCCSLVMISCAALEGLVDLTEVNVIKALHFDHFHPRTGVIVRPIFR